MLTRTHYLSFFKYIFTRRLFFLTLSTLIRLRAVVSFLLAFGFIVLLRGLSMAILAVTFFATRPLINHVCLFLRRSNRCYFSLVALRRLFFLSPSCLWLTFIDKRPGFIDVSVLKQAPTPVVGYLT